MVGREVSLRQFLAIRNKVFEDIVDARLHGRPGARLALQALIALSLKAVRLKGEIYAYPGQCVEACAIFMLAQIRGSKTEEEAARKLLIECCAAYV